MDLILNSINKGLETCHVDQILSSSTNHNQFLTFNSHIIEYNKYVM